MPQSTTLVHTSKKVKTAKKAKPALFLFTEAQLFARTSIWIANFDIGTKNHAYYVERTIAEVFLRLERKYHSLPKPLQKRVKSTNNKQIDDILHDLYLSGERVAMGVHDIRSIREKNAVLDNETRLNLFTHLDSLRELWTRCHIIVIEQQYFSTFTGKGKKAPGASGGANINAIKVAEATLAWFLINYPEKEIISFGAQYKTQILGAPAGLSKPQRKKWSEAKAKDILEERKDEDGLEQMRKGKRGGQKQDDVADCITMCQAYKFRHLVGNF